MALIEDFIDFYSFCTTQPDFVEHYFDENSIWFNENIDRLYENYKESNRK